ncbi:MAG: polyprenyl synthetase family protein, partial [Anaerolineales bacterium]|nr:polyprenyl synthetase family protein [Anaerolineales bacterium]
MLANQLDTALAQVRKILGNTVNSDVELLYDASHHIVDTPGKRLRPRITFLAYLAAGGTDLMEVAPIAAAIELVHTATLVHDDINDHSLTRRGRPTVHAIWDRTFALLTGDFLFTKVYEMMAPYGPEYNMIMADACVKLVEGETLQAIAAKNGEMDRESYRKIISRKTASLFEAGARMGALRGGGSEQMVAAMQRFGHDLGVAFQIIDDVLDIVGDPEAMGKPAGADLAQGRGVLAVNSNGKGTNGATAVAADPTQELINRVLETGAVDVARFEA